mmetsp:Transcript_5185/g.12263  ORF Transcript_5185/g.12263 Transcript_5185/m.12263 type:complete len:323 (+) Transcript_5185:370-1338(+)
MDPQDVQTCLFTGVGELDLPINSSRSQQSVVQDVNSVGRHDHLDSLRRLKPIQLVQQLQHRSLHLGITPGFPILSLGPDGIDLIHEDNGWSMLTRHHEQLSDHSASLSDVLLDKLRPRDADEAALGVVSNSTGQQGLPSSRRSVQKNTLRLLNTKGLKNLWMLDGQLNHFLDLLHLLLQPTDHLVCRVRHLLDLHQTHQRIDLAGQHSVQGVAVVAQRDSRVRLAIRDLNILIDVHNVLPLRPDLDQNLRLPHRLHDLPNMRARVQQQLQLFSEQSHLAVEIVSLCFQAPHILLLLPNQGLQLLDLPFIIRPNTHRRCLNRR